MFLQRASSHNEGNAASYIDRATAVIDPTTGRFEICGVAPGSYLLVASQFFAGRPLSGRVPVEVSAAAPPENVIIPLTAAFDIAGTVDVEGVPRGNVPNLTVQLVPAEGLTLGLHPSSKVGSDGNFRLSGVTPGVWTVVIDSLPQDMWVKSESLGSGETVSGEFTITENTRGQLRIMLAKTGGQISGTVLADGQPSRATIVLAPASPELRNSHQLYKIINANERGTFTLRGVPPGGYKLFGFQEIEPFGWLDPEILNMVDEMGEPVTVAPGDTVQRDLIAIPPHKLLH